MRQQFHVPNESEVSDSASENPLRESGKAVDERRTSCGKKILLY